MTPFPALKVLITGGSGPSGVAAAWALNEAGFTVFTVGSDQARIEAAASAAGTGVTPVVCDLSRLAEVQEMHAFLAGTAGPMDGVLHLVGGWRGAKGIADQSDEDWDFLERGAITTLRNVSRVFYDELSASTAGRFAMVSSTAVSEPTAGGASYVAAKAAAEAWTLAIADGFRRAQAEPRSAAVILVVKALVDATMREQHPERKFPGYTDVTELAAVVVGLFSQAAADLNGQRLLLNR